MEFISQLVHSRKSVRSYDGQPLRESDLKKLSAYIRKIDNPYGIPVEFRLLDAKEHGLSSPVITGENLYIGAKLRRAPHMEEAFGYAFEQMVLYAQSLGIGTVWIAGTMNRSIFERAMELSGDEVMPCVSPLGYPAKKPSLRDAMMRKGIRADSRRAFESMFFDGSLDSPLMQASAGRLLEPLEAVRRAPSAVNKQPWRVIITRNEAHFYLKHGKGFTAGEAFSVQKIDMGIALCHFFLTATEKGLNLCFCINDPGIEVQEDMEYIASYHF